jgi:hypothetical protein
MGEKWRIREDLKVLESSVESSGFITAKIG